MSNPYKENVKQFNNVYTQQSAVEWVGGHIGLGPTTVNFLKSHGLKKDSTLLDIGCGCFRIWEIVKECDYHALDVDENLIAVGKEMLEERGIETDFPTVVSDSFEFEKFDKQFDYMFCQGVVCHLTEDEVPVLFSKIYDFLKDDGMAFVTYIHRENLSKTKNVFFYNLDYFKTLHDGLDMELVKYHHPRGLYCVKLTKKKVVEDRKFRKRR